MSHHVLVIGASRGTGRAVVQRLLGQGHDVTAFARSASTALVDLVDSSAPGTLHTIDADALDATAVEKAMVGKDAVIVTLGISDNPLTVRLLRRASTALDVRSRGTAIVIAAMEDAGVHRLVVETAYGVGDTRRFLPLRWRMIYRLLLAPQIADSARQESHVTASGLEWTLLHPVALTDDAPDRAVFTSTDHQAAGFEIGRSQVAAVAEEAISAGRWVGQVVSISA